MMSKALFAVLGAAILLVLQYGADAIVGNKQAADQPRSLLNFDRAGEKAASSVVAESALWRKLIETLVEEKQADVKCQIVFQERKKE